MRRRANITEVSTRPLPEMQQGAAHPYKLTFLAHFSPLSSKLARFSGAFHSFDIRMAGRRGSSRRSKPVHGEIFAPTYRRARKFEWPGRRSRARTLAVPHLAVPPPRGSSAGPLIHRELPTPPAADLSRYFQKPGCLTSRCSEKHIQPDQKIISRATWIFSHPARRPDQSGLLDRSPHGRAGTPVGARLVGVFDT